MIAYGADASEALKNIEKTDRDYIEKCDQLGIPLAETNGNTDAKVRSRRQQRLLDFTYKTFLAAAIFGILGLMSIPVLTAIVRNEVKSIVGKELFQPKKLALEIPKRINTRFSKLSPMEYQTMVTEWGKVLATLKKGMDDVSNSKTKSNISTNKKPAG